jgi:hypothetical protein
MVPSRENLISAGEPHAKHVSLIAHPKHIVDALLLEKLRHQWVYRSQFTKPLCLDPWQICFQWFVCNRIYLGLKPILNVLVVDKNRYTSPRLLARLWPIVDYP